MGGRFQNFKFLTPKVLSGSSSRSLVSIYSDVKGVVDSDSFYITEDEVNNRLIDTIENARLLSLKELLLSKFLIVCYFIKLGHKFENDSYFTKAQLIAADVVDEWKYSINFLIIRDEILRLDNEYLTDENISDVLKEIVKIYNLKTKSQINIELGNDSVFVEERSENNVHIIPRRNFFKSTTLRFAQGLRSIIL